MIYWIPSIVVALTIIGLSHQSSLPSAAQIVPDYAWHFSVYLVFGVTLVFGHTRGFQRSLTQWAAAGLWLGAVLFAISDEFHQSFIAGRSAEGRDVMSDSLGSLAAIVGCWWWRRNA